MTPSRDLNGACPECGEWTPTGNPEAHDHLPGGSQAPKLRRVQDSEFEARDIVAISIENALANRLLAPYVMPELVARIRRGPLTHNQAMFILEVIEACLAKANARTEKVRAEIRALEAQKVTGHPLIDSMLASEAASLAEEDARHLQQPGPAGIRVAGTTI